MTRLVLKLLLKASLPLALLIGTLSYGVYLRGGDPAGLLRSIGAGIGERVASLAGGAADEARQGASRVGAAFDPPQDVARTTVFTWTDAGGVTHFASTAPEGVGATSIHVDPNVNVLAPLVGSRPQPESVSPASANGSPADDRSPPGPVPAAAIPDGSARLPGVAGMIDAGSGAGTSPRDAERLLRLLRGSGTSR